MVYVSFVVIVQLVAVLTSVSFGYFQGLYLNIQQLISIRSVFQYIYYLMKRKYNIFR